MKGYLMSGSGISAYISRALASADIGWYPTPTSVDNIFLPLTMNITMVNYLNKVVIHEFSPVEALIW